MESVDAFPVIKIVGGVVFATGGNLETVAGAVALESPDIVGGVLSGHRGVLAGSFLASSPPWITEDVHVRAPVCQSGHSSIVHCSCFIRHNLHNMPPTLIHIANKSTSPPYYYFN